VMETLETLPAVIASTKSFIHGAPYRVGPSAIGCRDNPYGKTTLDNPITAGSASPGWIRASAGCSARSGRWAMSPLSPVPAESRP